ncbi:hypothetical protein [uncultured Porphyromonas sp.]|jgi:hypothetical protein|uniref:hypothetical protein n=1 Tax=uncultured Porphyromonas sp. TaxID=159274 RepID=UPI00260C54F0|nr:hypothetical protein [uncultured Porphyromonas sp.]
MMKKLSVLGVSAVALLLSACNAISSIVGVPTDTKETWEKVQEIIEKKVDADKFKVIGLNLRRETRSGQELDNELNYCSVLMVDKDGAAWQQVFFVDGTIGNLSSYSLGEGRDFSDVPALDVKSISPEEYVKQIDAAKKIIEAEGLKFCCVDSYSIDNSRNDGERVCEFTLNVTEKEAKKVSNAGRTSIEYYEVPFVVSKQGVVSLEGSDADEDIDEDADLD